MTAEESEQLTKLIDQKWPNKFDVDDLDRWAMKLDRHSFHEVSECLSDWRLNSRMAPTIHDIEAALARRRPGAQAKSEPRVSEASHADVIRSTNQALRRENDAAVLLRYYRHTLFRRLKFFAKGGRQVATAERDRTIRLTAQQCVVELCAHGYVRTDAATAAEWIAAPIHQWQNFIQTIAKDALPRGDRSEDQVTDLADVDVFAAVG